MAFIYPPPINLQFARVYEVEVIGGPNAGNLSKPLPSSTFYWWASTNGTTIFGATTKNADLVTAGIVTGMNRFPITSTPALFFMEGNITVRNLTGVPVLLFLCPAFTEEL